jgi:DNA topoisomerase-1
MVGEEKPRTASLLTHMNPETLTLAEALSVLSLPRTLGNHPDDGAPIFAANGRYGPYITWLKESRSLASEDEIFTVDLAGALALLAQPKARGRRTVAPLNDLGTDEVTGRPVVVRSGRFGPYVTDGEVNATLRLGDTPESITLDRASELLAERRNAEPSRRPRAGAKKTAKKTTTSSAKKPARKATKKMSKKAATRTTASTRSANGAAKRTAVANAAADNAALAARVRGEA